MIPAAKKRAAIYARYSSDLQSPNSIADQLLLCRERAAAIGASIAGEYSDAAISGAALLNRPGINALMCDARAGAFDLVIAEAQDRLSRDMEDVAGLFKRLTHLGIGILTLAEGDISELHIGLKGTMNALFLKDMAAKVRRGQRGRVEKGRAGGGGIGYGYRIVKRVDANGDPERGLRAIAESTAPIVERIFHEYIHGKSPRAIAGSLNADAIPAPRGGPWNASTIGGNAGRRNGVLHNELYVGRLIYNRQNFRKDPDTGRRVPRVNPKSEWVTVDVPELRIIDDATWDLAQGLRRKMAERAPHQARRPKHLLSGLLRCADCGGPYVMASAGWLGCGYHKERRTCSNSRRIKAERLEVLVLDAIRDHLLSPDLVADYVKERQALIARSQADAGRQINEQRRRRDRLALQIRRATDAILEGTDTPELRRRLVELEEEKATLDRGIALVDTSAGKAAVALHPGLADQYRRRVAELRQALSSPEYRPEAVAILRELIDGISIRPLQNGQLQIELTASELEVLESTGLKRVGAGGSSLMNPAIVLVAPERFAQYRTPFTVRFLLD